MPVYKLAVNAKRTNEDDVVWTFHIDSPLQNAEAAADAYAQLVVAVLDDLNAGQTNTATSYLFGDATLDGGLTGEVDIYVGIAGVKPAPPSAIREATINPSTSSPALPWDVAICITEDSGVRDRGRYGRVYWGPLNRNSITADGKVSQAARTDLANMMRGLAVEIAAAGGELVIYSPTYSRTRPLEAAYVDGEFDTMRSRGARLSSPARTIVPIP